MSPTFRIVIATYNRPDDLKLCLDALLPSLEFHDNFKLVVVNDASHSNAYDQVLRSYQGKLEYRILPKNSGPAAARNMGLKDATEDYLICTDDDCIPPKFWLQWILALVASYPEVDLFAGTTRSALSEDEGSAWQSLLNLPTTYPTAHETEEGLLTAVTACSVLKREAFEAAGGFPEGIRGATEDCYLTQEVLRAGGSYYVPTILETRHKANQSLREMRKRFRWYGKGGVETSYIQNNWMLAGTGSNGSLKDAWKLVRVRARGMNQGLSSQTSKDLSWLNRMVASLVHWVISIEYEIGWFTTMRRYRRKGYRDLPIKPKGFARFD